LEVECGAARADSPSHSPPNRDELQTAVGRCDTSPKAKNTMKHVFAFVMILLSIYAFCKAAHDEHRGVAVVTRPGGISSGMFTPIIVRRNEDPEGFRNLMLYQWIRASLYLCGGLVILGISRRADRSDPLSRNFAGNSALDELNDELTKEQEKRRRPFR
jgi:hypothetical protein